MSRIADTPYGRVDAQVLEHLRNTFDTADLLQSVDALDAVRDALTDPEALRAEFIELHAMAHTVINGAAIRVFSRRRSLVDAAVDVESSLADLIDSLTAVRERVHRLTLLASGEL